MTSFVITLIKTNDVIFLSYKFNANLQFFY